LQLLQVHLRPHNGGVRVVLDLRLGQHHLQSRRRIDRAQRQVSHRACSKAPMQAQADLLGLQAEQADHTQQPRCC
jgi:hypothetical protein